MIGGLLICGVRVFRRFALLTKQNRDALDQNAVRWQESALRTETVIGLLTEIRDQIARFAPASPDPPPQNP
jgi:hypothetical protein